jgi:hypothetical protein
MFRRRATAKDDTAVRSYRIDELTSAEMQRLAERLGDPAFASGMPGLYWLPVPPDMLEAKQREHRDVCGPYAMALELRPGALSLELLVRARNALRCECIGYAGPDLAGRMIAYIDELLQDRGVTS